MFSIIVIAELACCWILQLQILSASVNSLDDIYRGRVRSERYEAWRVHCTV